jgi:hypothetical protein
MQRGVTRSPSSDRQLDWYKATIATARCLGAKGPQSGFQSQDKDFRQHGALPSLHPVELEQG